MIQMAILEASVALLAVLTMIWLGARLFAITKLGRKNVGRGRNLAIDEVLSLDSQRRLLLVTCGNQRVLLMTGGRQDLVVGWLDMNEAKP